MASIAALLDKIAILELNLRFQTFRYFDFWLALEYGPRQALCCVSSPYSKSESHFFHEEDHRVSYIAADYSFVQNNVYFRESLYGVVSFIERLYFSSGKVLGVFFAITVTHYYVLANLHVYLPMTDLIELSIINNMSSNDKPDASRSEGREVNPSGGDLPADSSGATSTPPVNPSTPVIQHSENRENLPLFGISPALSPFFPLPLVLPQLPLQLPSPSIFNPIINPWLLSPPLTSALAPLGNLTNQFPSPSAAAPTPNSPGFLEEFRPKVEALLKKLLAPSLASRIYGINQPGLSSPTTAAAEISAEQSPLVEGAPEQSSLPALDQLNNTALPFKKRRFSLETLRETPGEFLRSPYVSNYNLWAITFQSHTIPSQMSVISRLLNTVTLETDPLSLIAFIGKLLRSSE